MGRIALFEEAGGVIETAGVRWMRSTDSGIKGGRSPYEGFEGDRLSTGITSDSRKKLIEKMKKKRLKLASVHTRLVGL